MANEERHAAPRFAAREWRLAGLEVPHDERISSELGILVEIAFAPHAQLQTLGLELSVLHRSFFTGSTTCRPSISCWSASRCTPSIALAAMMRAASKNWHFSSAAIDENAALRPAEFSRAVENFSAIVPVGVAVWGGATIRISGTGMSGSIGARRIARTSDAMPCAEC